MTTPHRTLQMALDALDAITDDVDGTGLNTMPSFDKALDAIAALREAMAAPEPEPVALESVHLTRDTRGMCVVRVNGRIAIRDNGDIIDHMATLEWFAAPPAAPIPDGMVMVPREPTEEMIQAAAGAWGESESGLHNAFAAALRGGIAAAPAAPVVPDLKHCACEFDGDTCVTQCKLHAAHVDAIHEWAERAKAAEANMLAAPVVPLTDEQLAKIAVEDEFLLYCDQDSFNEIARAIEAAHGITGASK